MSAAISRNGRIVLDYLEANNSADKIQVEI